MAQYPTVPRARLGRFALETNFEDTATSIRLPPALPLDLPPNKMLSFTIITIFPEMFASPLGHSILKKAQEKGLISVRLVDPRDFATDKHRMTDDYPYGGGQGMVMKPEPLVAAIEAVRGKRSPTGKPAAPSGTPVGRSPEQEPPAKAGARVEGSPHARVILLSPQGSVFNQRHAARLAQEKELVLICGRYEGVDERVKSFVDEELSIGDYTLSGGEPAANVVIDAVARLIPGVLGNEGSAADESFVNGLLEYPQYTRPEDFRGMKVPDVLLSGDHERVARWRREMSLKLTRERRPDLLEKTALTAEEKNAAPAIRAPLYLALLHYPVYDKNGQVVTTAVTNMDIHDIARSGKTSGIKAFYVVTPVKALQKLARKIIDHWEEGYGSQYNVTRKEALALARISDTLDDVLIDIERESGEKPLLVVTSARAGEKRASFAALRDMLKNNTHPFLILFGTGWGLTEAIFSQADYVLEAIEGTSGYNHLSVRSAAAIVLDRLLGQS
ncbi:MAG: tRNA (guanosine(37)-N1)-methyltransferase TrmD [Deltaproteobacteria bacterium]|nr:tRNA (guanosine(37)-N1)-methyltransferase TrmD [Deltaproteobacteria bacterium]